MNIELKMDMDSLLNGIIPLCKQVICSYLWFFKANQQAKDIIANNNFGQHALFYESAKIVPNEYFSEITVRANIQAPLPTEDAFATVLLNNFLKYIIGTFTKYPRAK